ncbi:MAG TPA: UvrD-helicase domain-containing protein, partial [Planctomycetota bacterium]|nr:UvrD-helicase domain-containing protein [Planctomycetota bacterium]
MAGILDGLNSEQRRAVEQTEGPVLVLAGAGSGKTRVITCRIAHLLAKKVSARNILAMTFTNKAAREMRERVAGLVGAATAKELTVSTFHSFCVRVLREHAETLGLSKSFTICDDSDQLTAVKGALREMRIAEAAVHPRAALSKISLFKSRLVTPVQALAAAEDDWEDLVARTYRAYNDHLKRSRTVDFDDLLLLVGELLEKHPEVGRKYQDRYRYVMVDEYQDTNGPQYEILKHIAGKHRNLCVVGDDDQCLVAGTLVSMADGSRKPIEQVRVGDQVRSSHGCGEFRAARVSRTFATHRAGEGVAIRLRSGKSIAGTPEHTHFAGYRPGCDPEGPGPRSRPSSPRTVAVTLCGDRRGASPLHCLSIAGTDARGRAELQSLGYSVRAGRRDPRSWRFECVTGDFGTIHQVVSDLGKRLDGNPILRARLGADDSGIAESQSLPFVPASAVKRGMAMFSGDGGYEIVDRVDRIALDEPVYDLDVERTHNFIANGIVTHNSIYGWRGADVRKILHFEKDFPGATVIRLETNYRSTEQILAAANAVIRNNKSRHEKTLKAACGSGEAVRLFPCEDEEHESEFVVDEIQRDARAGRVKFGDIAILFRTAVQPRPFEARLRAARIPYDLVGGMSFFDRKEVRDVLAYVRLAANPFDEASLLRVVNVPPRGVGKASMDKVVDQATRDGVSAAAVFDRGAPEGVSAETFQSVRSFRRVLADFAAKVPTAGLVPALRELIVSVKYHEEIARCYPDAITQQARTAAVGEVVNVAEAYARRSPTPSLEGFLEEITLSTEDSREESQEQGPRDQVTLMTLHAAKGLEF